MYSFNVQCGFKSMWVPVFHYLCTLQGLELAKIIHIHESLILYHSTMEEARNFTHQVEGFIKSQGFYQGCRACKGWLEPLLVKSHS